LALIALSVVVLIKVVGIILLIALLAIPAAICKQYTYDIRKLMISSTIIGAILTSLGLILAFLFNLSSGATIILVLGAALFISYFIQE